MVNLDNKILTKHLTPTNLDFEVMDTKVPSSKHQSYSLGASCDDCNNGTVMLFTEEVRNPVEKVPFACLHAGYISTIQLNTSTNENGSVLATPRPELPVLPDMEDEPSATAKIILAGASFIASVVEMGKLQQGSNGLKDASHQLTVAKNELRNAIYESEEGVAGYLYLEIKNIGAFMDNIDLTEAMIVNVNRAMDGLDRLAKVENEDNPTPN